MRENGLSRPTLYKPHIQDYLMKQKEFNSSLIPFEELQAEADQKDLAQCRLENQKLKLTIITLTEKIERLENQILLEKNKRKAEKFELMEKRGLLIAEQMHNRIT